MSSASLLSENLAAQVESTATTVVRVEARRSHPASGVVWADGVIVTAHHAVRRDENVRVGAGDAQTLEATVAGRDPRIDLAVLRADTTALVAPAWSDPVDLRVGHLVLALARPGRAIRAALGVVSALGETWRTPGGGKIERYVETDVVLRPGFSGGLVVDAEGRTVGLGTTGVLRGRHLVLVPAVLRKAVEAILAGGEVRRGYLGVGCFPVRLPADLARSLGQPSALLIASIEPGSPAATAGLLQGDALAALDGQPLAGLGDLLAQLDEDRVGKSVRLTVIRAGERREVEVMVGARG